MFTDTYKINFSRFLIIENWDDCRAIIDANFGANNWVYSISKNKFFFYSKKLKQIFPVGLWHCDTERLYLV